MPHARKHLGAVSDHLTLVRRMARSTGTDLTEAMHSGQLSTKDWADMVTNCRGCACTETCRSHLTAQELSDTTTRPPEYCENRATFDRLARQTA